MCMLWCLLQLVVIFLYWDLPPQEQEKTEESCSTDTEDQKSREEDDEDDDEEKPLMPSQELVGSYGSVVPANTNHTSSPSSKPQYSDKPSSSGFFSSRGKWLTALWPVVSVNLVFKYKLWPSVEFLREEVIVLLAAQFITLFNQTALEVQ